MKYIISRWVEEKQRRMISWVARGGQVRTQASWSREKGSSIIWNLFQNTIELCLVDINENRKTSISFAKSLPKYMKIHWINEVNMNCRCLEIKVFIGAYFFSLPLILFCYLFLPPPLPSLPPSPSCSCCCCLNNLFQYWGPFFWKSVNQATKKI